MPQYVLFEFMKNLALQPTYREVGSAVGLPGAIRAARSPLIRSYGYRSADDRTDYLARFPLRSELFMNYPGQR